MASESFPQFKNQAEAEYKSSSWSVFVFCLGTLLRGTITNFGFLLTEFLHFFWPPKPKSIAGQLALVTGGANGLGKALCLRFAREGCNVAVVDLDLVNAEQVAEELQNFGVKSKAYKVDVTDIDAVRQMKQYVENDLGPVDILVNNAGIIYQDANKESDPRDIKRMIDVNLTANCWTILTFLDSMIKRQRGHILAISSACAYFAVPQSYTYTATKTAIKGLMEAISLDLYLRGLDKFIKTTTAHPYFINTRNDLKTRIFNETKHHIMLSPSETADVIINAVLRDRAQVFIPSGLYWMNTFVYLPLPVKKASVKDEIKNHISGW